MSAKTTESGRAPAGKTKLAPTMIENATAATAGAMCVTDWKNTPLKPTAPLRNPVVRCFTSNVGHRALPRRSGLECYAARL